LIFVVLGAILWGYFSLLVWTVRLLASKGILAPGRRLVPCSGWEVLALFFLVQFFWPNVVFQTLHGTKVFRESPSAGEVAQDSENQEAESTDSAPESPLQRARERLWVAFCSFPLQAGSILGLLWLGSRTRPRQLGLTAEHLGRDATFGAVGWFLLAPPVFILNLLVTLVYQQLWPVKEAEHPLTRLLSNAPPLGEKVLLVLVAAVAAPIIEELLFRGVLQTWLTKRRWGGLVAMSTALLLAGFERWPMIARGWREGSTALLLQGISAPVYVLLMIGGYFFACWLAGQWLREHSLRVRLAGIRSTGAIYATALAFAAAHTAVWPSPIALFFLALGLGYLAYRTRSLIGPMVMHGLFNSISCIVLLLQPHVEKGKEATAAVPRVAPVSNSTTVPGS
jgi:membrane protease YdiL (CAAX protease family)